MHPTINRRLFCFSTHRNRIKFNFSQPSHFNFQFRRTVPGFVQKQLHLVRVDLWKKKRRGRLPLVIFRCRVILHNSVLILAKGNLQRSHKKILSLTIVLREMSPMWLRVYLYPYIFAQHKLHPMNFPTDFPRFSLIFRIFLHCFVLHSQYQNIYIGFNTNLLHFSQNFPPQSENSGNPITEVQLRFHFTLGKSIFHSFIFTRRN